MSHHTTDDANKEEMSKEFDQFQDRLNRDDSLIDKKKFEEILSKENKNPTSNIQDVQKQVAGLYPDGKLGDNDAGAITCQIEVLHPTIDGELDTTISRLRLTFPHPVKEVMFTREDAIRFLEGLQGGVDHMKDDM